MTQDTRNTRRRTPAPILTSALETAYRKAKAQEVIENALRRIAAAQPAQGTTLDGSDAAGLRLIAKAALRRAEKIVRGE